MKKYSKLMRAARVLGLNSLAWSLRRLYCPVPKDALVLEVGSGGNPYYRSNVLLDAYFETRERHYKELVADRPTVLGFVENLPFQDDSFDFVVASNVLEHSFEPEKFISEIQRVGKAGYIEVPDAFFERLNGYRDHKLEITDVNDMLMIRKKTGYIQDQELRELFQNKTSEMFPKIMSLDPFKFSVVYYWDKSKSGIKYRIVNEDYVFDWTPPIETEESLLRYDKKSLLAYFKSSCLTFARRFFSQNSRNKSLNVVDLLRCSKCHHPTLTAVNGGVECSGCNAHFEYIDQTILKLN
jgi:SAM-dependent methyltransferase